MIPLDETAPQKTIRRIRRELMRMLSEWGAEAPSAYDNWWPRIERFLDEELKDLNASYEAWEDVGRWAQEKAEKARRDLAHLEARVAAAEVSAVPDLFKDGFDPRGAFVYLLWGEDETTPLYVGMSVNVLGRLGSHMASKMKNPHVHRVTLIPCKDRDDAIGQEYMLIRAYQPPWNRDGVDRDIRHHPAA